MTTRSGVVQDLASPAFAQLPILPGLGHRHSWDVFGREDNLGTLNWLTPEITLAALAEARTGEVVNLNLPIHEPDPPLFGRQPVVRVIESHGRNSFDDKLDNYYLQSGTQWDGLLHQRAREFGFYGGRTQDPEVGQLWGGVDHWARHGIVGRGVLLDVARWRSSRGEESDSFAPTTTSDRDLLDIARSQGVELRIGDILCMRFGWTGKWLGLDNNARHEYAGRLKDVTTRTFAGLSANEAMSEFLWDHHVVCIACDNPAVEVSPGDPKIGSLHRRLIPMLGFLLGELFDFEDLARRCEARTSWSFVFFSGPLNVVGGIGTPANAYAVL